MIDHDDFGTGRHYRLGADHPEREFGKPQTVAPAAATRPTFGERMAEQKGKATGFDHLKIGMAFTVIGFHSIVTCYGVQVEHQMASGFVRPFILAILPMFFAMSGFLVTASLLRAKTMAEYVVLRMLRIVPALCVAVCVAALVLGPLLTLLPLRHYFADVSFYSYFLNVIGKIQFQLPGMFIDNPDPGMVNRQLWTIPGELKCYIILCVFALAGITRRPILMLAVVVAAALIFPIIDVAIRKERLDGLNSVTAHSLILAFCCGVTAYLYRDRLRLGASFLALAAVLSYALLFFPYTQYIAVMPLTYVTVSIGLAGLPRSVLSSAGNYSYGLYLYGYPIQQTYSLLFPEHRIWWLNILFTLTIGLALAMVSWRFVEQPMLRQRPRAVALVNRLLAAAVPQKWAGLR